MLSPRGDASGQEPAATPVFSAARRRNDAAPQIAISSQSSRRLGLMPILRPIIDAERNHRAHSGEVRRALHSLGNVLDPRTATFRGDTDNRTLAQREGPLAKVAGLAIVEFHQALDVFRLPDP